jgi:hypothetical protein
MRSWLKTIGVALAGFVVGATAGAAVGFEVASNSWARMSQVLSVATGGQAYNAIVLLDANRQGQLREYLEAEVDSTIASLQGLQAKRPFAVDDPLARLNERLVAYRAKHPRRTAGMPAGTP